MGRRVVKLMVKRRNKKSLMCESHVFLMLFYNKFAQIAKA